MITLPPGVTDGNNPRIGWQNLITFDNVTAGSEDPLFPVTNLSNPATNEKWKAGSTSATTVVVDLGSARSVDYVGIARHNLGTAGVDYQVESSPDGSAWTAAGVGGVPLDDAVIVEQFAAVTRRYWRLSLGAASTPASIAVLYFGRLLILERRIYVGHTPLPDGRRATVSSGRSEDGEFLGRIVRNEVFETDFKLENITPEYYRTDVRPFATAAPDTPFFWAWRPEDYPEEVGYVWSKGDVTPANQRSNGMMAFSCALQGILE